MSFQLFTSFKNLLWLPICSLTLCHFSIQRKLLIEVWRANNQDVIYNIRGETTRCYSRYYFFVIIAMMFLYKIFTVDSMMIMFFGTLWLPQIVQYSSQKRQNARSEDSYKLSPGFIISSSLHFLFFPAYLRGCPLNIL